MRLGDYNRLRVSRAVDFGLYLDGGEAGDILLPTRYVPKGTQIGDELTVFLYLDQEERLIATTDTPLCRVGDFAYLEVAWVNKYGAFLKWGLMKDLFCPFREQKRRMEQGQSYIVHVHLDEESYRIVASAKVEHYFDPSPAPYVSGDEVDLLIWQKTELGFKVIVDNRWPGLVYENQVFQDIQTGDRMKGYILQVRQDGKIDIALQPTGFQKTEDFARQLYHYLLAHDGYTPLGDKSDAEEIKREFQVSKKTFKRAVGQLYKQQIFTIAPDGIRLTEGE